MADLKNDPMLIRQIIMDHYEYPRHKGLIEDETYLKAHMASDSCIDDIEIQVKIENGVVVDARFDGVACTISTASTSILTELLIGKTVLEAKEIVNQYMNMVYEKPYDEDLLEEAVAFANVSKQANRIKCATIGFNGALEIFKQLEEEGLDDHKQ